MKLFSSKKRIGAIGAVAALTLVGGGVAYGYWTTTGSGDGSAKTGVASTFTVVGQSQATGLTPGGPAGAVKFKIHNPGTGSQFAHQVTVSVAKAGGAAWTDVVGCTAADFVLGDSANGVAYTLIVDAQISGGADSDEISVPVQMWNNASAAQNACKDVVVPLHYEIS